MIPIDLLKESGGKFWSSAICPKNIPKVTVGISTVAVLHRIGERSSETRKEVRRSLISEETKSHRRNSIFPIS